MITKLWVFQATATASQGCTYPVGEVHPLLVFAAAPDREAAFDKVYRAISAHGWQNAEVSRSGEIPSDLSTIKDSDLRASAKHALDHTLDHGCGIVAYSNPIKPREETSQ